MLKSLSKCFFLHIRGSEGISGRASPALDLPAKKWSKARKLPKRNLTVAMGPAEPPGALGPSSRAHLAPEELRCFLQTSAKDDFSGWLACTGKVCCSWQLA